MIRRKISYVILSITLTVLILVSFDSMVYAKATGILTRDSDGKLYEYDYNDLLMSIMGDKVLYKDFRNRAEVVAYKDDTKGYVEFSYLVDQYMNMGKSNFVLNEVLENAPLSRTIILSDRVPIIKIPDWGKMVIIVN